MVSRFDLYKKAGDEAIEDDPAYNIDNLRQDVKSVGKTLYGQPGGVPDTADLVQGFFRGIDPAVELFTPGKDKADREDYTKIYEQEEAKRKELSDQYGDVSGRFGYMEKAKAINEAMGDRQTSGAGQFFRNILGPGADATKELAQGKPFYELSPMQMADAAFAVVDLVDVIGIKTLLAKGLTSGARKLAQSIDNAVTREDKLRIAQSADPKTIMELRGGGGQFTGTVTKEKLTDAVNNYFQKNPNEKISTKRLSQKLGFEKNYSLLKGIFNQKTFPNNVINEVDLKAKEEIATVMNKIRNSNIEEVSLKKMAEESGTTIGKLRHNLITRREENLKNGIITQGDVELFDSILASGKTPQVIESNKKINQLKKDLTENPDKQGKTVSYYTQNYDIPKSTLVTAKQNDPDLYALTTRTDREGVPVEFTTADEQTFYAKGKAAGKVKSLEESDFLFDLYRGRKNELNITEEQFFNQLPNNWRDKTTNTFNSYKKLEAERKSLQNDNYNFFKKIYEDPENAKILGNTFEQDQGNFTLDKAHAYFIGDATKEGRMADMSLYEDMMYISPKGSNIKVQEAFDKPIRQIINFYTDNKKRNEFKKIKLEDTTLTGLERKTGIRINSMINSLRKNNIEFDINNFETLDDLFFSQNGLVNSVNDLYQQHKIGTLLPVKERVGKRGPMSKSFGLIGDNPQSTTAMEKIDASRNRFLEILKQAKIYEITGGKSGKPIKRDKSNFIIGMKDGGQIKPVKMAIGGDPLQNINQQQFASDPATDDNFFQQAVQDENLLAFNPANLFKIFKQAPAVATPNKVVGGVSDAPTNMLPATAKVDIDDFPFKSHFIDTLSEQNIPNIDSPQGWRNLFEGTKGFAKSELEGAGIMGYLEDAEKFMPGMKITKQNLLDVYEKSPIANLEIKVKTEVPMPGEYKNYVGSAKHKNMGNAEIDKGGTDYRNIVINVKEIPGQDKAFYNQGHFDKDPNVLAFTRVANYKNATGDDVAVIQELQTDLITNLRKEQERVKATASAVRNRKERLQQNLINYPNDEYTKADLDRLNAQYPEEKLKFLETTDLTRPADPIFLEQLAPELTTQLNAIQDQINNILAQNRGRIVNPNYLEQIKQLQDQGLVVFNRLFDLNRQKNFDDMLQGTKVTDAYQSSQILDIGAGTNVPTGRDVQSFGQIPFGKGPDWIDLMLKSTIQDAQSRGINKVAIMPAEIVNQRWGKDATGAAGEKFKAIYDKISVQELKNIAKKYTGNKANLQIEEIVDPNKPQQGFRILNKNVSGEYDKLRDLDANTTIPNRGPEDTEAFNYEILKLAEDYDFGEVIVRKEIAPGQSMDYAVKIKKAPVDEESGLNFQIDVEDTFELVPTDESVSPQLIIEEFNPSLQKMYVLTMPEETTKKGPMFLFRKKDGGKIKSDGLVSITDIYGDY